MYCQSQFANRCPPFRFECLSVDLNLSVSEIELIFLLGYGFLTHTAQFLTLDHQVFPIRGARNLGVPTDSFLTSLTMHLSCWNLLYVVPQIHLPPPPNSPGLGFYCHITMGTSAASRFLLSSCHSLWYHIGYLWTQLCSHSFLTA